jgi:ABC-type phosphate transport system substrate-binding protein
VSSIGSYDATGSATIQTKAGGPSFVRPNGSGAGANALSDSAQGGTHLFNSVDITGQVDFARSSSGPSGSGTALTYIPFAKDAVTFAVNAASDFPRDIPIGSSSQDSTSPV